METMDVSFAAMSSSILAILGANKPPLQHPHLHLLPQLDLIMFQFDPHEIDDLIREDSTKEHFGNRPAETFVKANVGRDGLGLGLRGLMGRKFPDEGSRRW